MIVYKGNNSLKQRSIITYSFVWQHTKYSTYIIKHHIHQIFHFNRLSLVSSFTIVLKNIRHWRNCNRTIRRIFSRLKLRSFTKMKYISWNLVEKSSYFDRQKRIFMWYDLISINFYWITLIIFLKKENFPLK